MHYVSTQPKAQRKQEMVLKSYHGLNVITNQQTLNEKALMFLITVNMSSSNRALTQNRLLGVAFKGDQHLCKRIKKVSSF